MAHQARSMEISERLLAAIILSDATPSNDPLPSKALIAGRALRVAFWPLGIATKTVLKVLRIGSR